MGGLRAVAARAGQPLLVQGIGPVFNTCFTDAPALHDYREYTTRTDPNRQLQFVARLVDEGVRLTSRGTWFLSAAHTAEDVEHTIRAAERALARM
jgi:glutamate-1-semialdehyde 2,1-aminomutase